MQVGKEDIDVLRTIELHLPGVLVTVGKPARDYYNCVLAPSGAERCCPKCKGRGYVSKRYNAYPSGLPDSGWVDDWKKTDVECDLCKGHGWTEKEWKPKMVQDGWE